MADERNPVASTSAATSEAAPPTHEPVAGPSNARHTTTPTSPDPLTRRRRTPFFPSAAQPEIIRANQKDLYYLGELGEQVEDAARGLLGTRWLQSWAQELSVFSKLAYFSLTTVLGTQTLGEEYCDILQYTEQDRRMPSRLRRSALVFLHVVAPYACVRLYGALRRQLQERRRAQAAEGTDRQPLLKNTAAEKQSLDVPTTSTRLRSWLSTVELPSYERLFDDHLTAVHLAIFYLTGRYYHASKRATGVRYLATQSSSALGSTRPPSYEILGLLMAIQLLVRLAMTVRAAAPAPPVEPTPADKAAAEKQKVRRKPTLDGRPLDALVFDPEDPTPAAEEEEEDADAPFDPASQARRCTLCLGPRRDPTSTECGHVFCWECIVGWAREKLECPLCRQSVQLAGLLPVYNL